MTRAVQHVGIPGYGWQAGGFLGRRMLLAPRERRGSSPTLSGSRNLHRLVLTFLRLQ